MKVPLRAMKKDLGSFKRHGVVLSRPDMMRINRHGFVEAASNLPMDRMKKKRNIRTALQHENEKNTNEAAPAGYLTTCEQRNAIVYESIYLSIYI
jgi:hypothetical protein